MSDFNQKGSISMMMLIFVVTASVIITSQMPGLYKSLNSINANKRNSLQDNTQLLDLAQILKAKRRMYTLDQTCSSYTSPSHSMRSINGMNFCVPNSGGICTYSLTNDADLRDRLKQCIRMDNTSLNWQASSGVAVPSTARAEPLSPYSRSAANSSFSFRNKSAQIQVPATSDTSIWRTCPTGSNNDSGCVRLSLCPLGRTTCSASQVTTEVVVRIGTL